MGSYVCFKFDLMMERLHYQVSFVDNGVIVKDTDTNAINVYQSKGGEADYREYTERAMKESIGDMLAALMLDSSDNSKIKDKFNIKIEIR